jgi:hypothetical protein
MKFNVQLLTTLATTLVAATAANAQLNQIPGNSPSPLGKPGVPTRPVVQTVTCPPSIIAQATNAPSPWLPGGVTMSLQSAALTSPGAPAPQMICKYAGSGAAWQIYRNVQPEFKSCAVSGTQFVCQKT